jgi:hypothetical protein
MKPSSSEENSPQTPDEGPKNPHRSFRDAKPVPPDHWIYQQGPQFGFVSALPASLIALQKKKK